MSRKNKRDRGGNGGSRNSRGMESWGNFDFEEPIPHAKNPQLKLLPFSPRTDSQKQAYQIVKDNTLAFLGGPAGTGKTLILCRTALEYLEKGLVKKIVVTRPNIEAGKSLGYLPGSSDEKMYNYLVPILDNFEIFIGQEKLKQLMEEKVIECVPVGFMRGRTFNNAFIIVDEGQNLTYEQFVMIFTRIGFDSFAGITFDENQVDIKRDTSCADKIFMFEGCEDVGYFEFDVSDVVRSKIVKTLLQRIEDIKNGDSGII